MSATADADFDPRWLLSDSIRNPGFDRSRAEALFNCAHQCDMEDCMRALSITVALAAAVALAGCSDPLNMIMVEKGEAG